MELDDAAFIQRKREEIQEKHKQLISQLWRSCAQEKEVPFVMLVNSYPGRSNPQTWLQKGNTSMQGLSYQHN